uniref:glycosyltransferase n=1 Tax=Escherichia coli TaxID=562 RepID=UPI0039C23CFD
LFYCVKFPLASETFVLNQIVSFIKMGYEVEILSVYPGDLDKLHEDYIKYELRNKVSYIFDKDISLNNKIYQLGIRAWYSIKSLVKGHFSSFNVSQFGFLSYSLVLPSLIGRMNKKLNGDIIVAHFGPCGVLANALRSSSLLQGKVVTVFHGYDLSATVLLKRYKLAYKSLFLQGDLFLPVSNMWKNRLLDMGCTEEKIGVVRMGIQLKDFPFKPRKLNTDCIRLISVCRLTEKKGIKYAISACNILNRAGYNFHYTIIGYGELLDELNKMIIDLDLKSKVDIIGFQPQSIVKKMLSNSDVFLLPSVTASNGDMEGIPVALMEAMATGLPVISSYHSGIPELIQNDYSGWLCQEGNSQEIANCIIKLIEDKVEINDIEKNARNHIELNFNQDNEYNKMATMLEHIR